MLAMLELLERKFGRFAVPHLPIVLIVVWIAGFILVTGHPRGGEVYQSLLLIPDKVFEGEYWRLFSFLIAPPITDFWILFLFALWFAWWVGSSVESTIGVFRFNVLVGASWLAVIAGVMGPSLLGYNQLDGVILFLNTLVLVPVFYTMAWHYPNQVVYVLLVIPFKIKWMAWIMLFFTAVVFLDAGWIGRCAIVGAHAGFLILYGRELVNLLARKQRRVQQSIADAKEEATVFHTCATCGATEKTHPERRFFICEECDPPTEYCDQHIKDHEHKVRDSAPADSA